jgi:hypothetical protein
MDIGMPPSPMALTVTGPMVLVCMLLFSLLFYASADRNTGKTWGMPGGAGALSAMVTLPR